MRAQQCARQLFNIINTNRRVPRLQLRGCSTRRSTHKTIFALSSAPGRAGISVIRISGPNAAKVVERMTDLTHLPPPRVMTKTKLYAPHNDAKNSSFALPNDQRDLLDELLLVYFKSGQSWTGEDTIELYCHGSTAIVRDVLANLGQLPDFVPAAAGDFARRALIAGRLSDVTAVEGLADLLSAETSTQRQAALWALRGHVGEIYRRYSRELTQCLAYCEALIDFGEDEGVEVQHESKNSNTSFFDSVKQKLISLRDQMSRDLVLARKSQLIRSGVHVTVLGRANAGKSSVMNRLARRDVSIVSPIRGTTRDVVRARVEIQGMAVELSDTAGLNASTSDPLELEGIRRTRDVHAHETDIALALVDLEALVDIPSLLAAHRDTLDMVAHNTRTILVFNKYDLAAEKFTRDELLQSISAELPDSLKTASRVLVSCASGEGLDELMTLLEQHVTDVYAAGDTAENQAPVVIRERHRRELEECVTCLNEFLETARVEQIEIGAEQLRRAIRALGRITGHVDVEALLDVIFRDFCIGK